MNTERQSRALPKVLLLSFVILLLPLSYLMGRTLRNEDNVTVAQTDTTATPAIGAGAALVNPPHPVRDFQLMDQQGNPLRLSDLRGRPILLFFGYTHCPDECPATLANFLRVERALGADAEKVAFMFISVDPERDTTSVIADYLALFSPNFIGLRGEEPVLSQIAPDYMLAFESEGVQVNLEHEHGDATVEPHNHDTDEPHDHAQDDHHADEDYLIQHTSPAFLIDANGYLRMLFFANTEVEVILNGVQQIMALPQDALLDDIMPTATAMPLPTLEATVEVTPDATLEATPDATAEAVSAEVGDAARGAALFETFQPQVGTVCTTCHLVTSDDRLVGPGLLSIGERAATRVSGQSAAEYILTSIVEPGAYIVEDYPDVMPKNWEKAFTEAQLNDLVAYLLSLQGE